MNYVCVCEKVMSYTHTHVSFGKKNENEQFNLVLTRQHVVCVCVCWWSNVFKFRSNEIKCKKKEIHHQHHWSLALYIWWSMVDWKWTFVWLKFDLTGQPFNRKFIWVFFPFHFHFIFFLSHSSFRPHRSHIPDHGLSIIIIIITYKYTTWPPKKKMWNSVINRISMMKFWGFFLFFICHHHQREIVRSFFFQLAREFGRTHWCWWWWWWWDLWN